ncbi:hypothetical protein RYZ27_14790 [Hyphomonas sp. FCG-A18]|nr:hypothetical protein RYZ27_14790 [Hyphomonas sp. FCG-A18]
MPYARLGETRFAPSLTGRHPGTAEWQIALPKQSGSKRAKNQPPFWRY